MMLVTGRGEIQRSWENWKVQLGTAEYSTVRRLKVIVIDLSEGSNSGSGRKLNGTKKKVDGPVRKIKTGRSVLLK